MTTKSAYQKYATATERMKEALIIHTNIGKADTMERTAALEIIDCLAKVALEDTREAAEAHWKRIGELASVNIAEEF